MNEQDLIGKESEKMDSREDQVYSQRKPHSNNKNNDTFIERYCKLTQ